MDGSTNWCRQSCSSVGPVVHIALGETDCWTALKPRLWQPNNKLHPIMSICSKLHEPSINNSTRPWPCNMW
jgi:hypothetical protein